VIPLAKLKIMDKPTAYAGQLILFQILSLCPQKELAAIIHEAKSDYTSKRLKQWEHFVTILSFVLSGCSPYPLNRQGA